MYFPKGIFPSDKLPRVFFQVFTSQMCNLISGNVPSHSARSPSSSKPQRPPPLQTWEVVLGKMSFGKHLTALIMYLPLVISRE